MLLTTKILKMIGNVNVFLSTMILAVVLQTVNSALTMDQMKQAASMIRKVCQPKTKVSTELIDALNEGTFTDDRNLKCYMKCAMQMMQAMSSNGKMKPEAAMAQAKKMLPLEIRDRTLVALEKCLSVGEENAELDSCDLAFVATKCVYEADSEIFLFP